MFTHHVSRLARTALVAGMAAAAVGGVATEAASAKSDTNISGYNCGAVAGTAWRVFNTQTGATIDSGDLYDVYGTSKASCGAPAAALVKASSGTFLQHPTGSVRITGTNYTCAIVSPAPKENNERINQCSNGTYHFYYWLAQDHPSSGTATTPVTHIATL